MNRLFIISVFLILLSFGGKTQITPVQNQYAINPYIYNPAWAGKHEVMQFNAGFKKQWIGLSGSPMLNTLLFEMPIGKQMSLGGNIVNFNYGPINYTTLHASNSYKLPFDADYKHYISFGVSLGVCQSHFNISKLDDPNDPVVANLKTNSLLLDVGFGIAYKNKGLETGLSMPSMSEQQKLNNAGIGVELKPLHHFIMAAGYRYNVFSDFDAIPTLLYHYEKEFDNQFEALLNIEYQKNYRIGFGYRRHYGMHFMAGGNITDMFGVNYYYGTSLFYTQKSSGSHEIILTVRLGNLPSRSNDDSEYDYDYGDDDDEEFIY